MTFLTVYEDVHPIWAEKPNTDIRDDLGEPYEDPTHGTLFPWTPSGTIDYWVDVRIECVPSNSHWPWRRWFCEVLARRSIWPPHKNEDKSESEWYHYYRYDFYALSLRRAFWKAYDVALDLQEHMQADPSERPDYLPFDRHTH